MEKHQPVEVYNLNGKHISNCTTKRASQMVARKKADWIGLNKVVLLITREMEKEIRKEVRKRDGDVCIYCDKHLEEHEITYDHLNPRKGRWINGQRINGEESVENLAVACGPCNEDKANLTYEEYFLLLAQRIWLMKNGYLLGGLS